MLKHKLSLESITNTLIKIRQRMILINLLCMINLGPIREKSVQLKELQKILIQMDKKSSAKVVFRLEIKVILLQSIKCLIHDRPIDFIYFIHVNIIYVVT